MHRCPTNCEQRPCKTPKTPTSGEGLVSLHAKHIIRVDTAQSLFGVSWLAIVLIEVADHVRQSVAGFAVVVSVDWDVSGAAEVGDVLAVDVFAGGCACGFGDVAGGK